MAPDRASWLRLQLGVCALLVPGSSGLSVGSLYHAAARPAVHRPGAITSLEAFDLLPVVDCLKLDAMDEVQACMDKIEPWMELTEGGGLAFSMNAVNGFIGGSVGVVGTIIATMVKKGQVKERLVCTYCDGTGQILCGHCLGTNVVATIGEDGSITSQPCPNCEATGTVVCINCQGSGISVPEDFLRVLGDEEVGFTEEDYIGLFDETPIPGRTMPERKPKTPVAAGADAAEGKPKPVDFTGGMG